VQDRVEDEVIELPLLLSSRQAAALEEIAQLTGLTVGQLVRLLVRDYLGSRQASA
jgi:hypothetical protein